MDKPPNLLRAATPAGHPALLAVWLVSALCLSAGIMLAALQLSFGLPLAALGGMGLAGGWVAFLVRLARHRRRLAGAELLLSRGELAGAREILRPLLGAFPGAPEVQRAAGLLLYASGDPLSSAALLEQALAALGPDSALVTTLVAAYAALNKGGDARRAARVMAGDPDVRLALAWSELVVLGGDPRAAEGLISSLVHVRAIRETSGRRGMLAALVAIVDVRAGRAGRMRERLGEIEAGASALGRQDQAFISYLGAIALREAGDLEGARRTLTGALALDPEGIAGALARRERSHLPEPVAPPSPPDPDPV